MENMMELASCALKKAALNDSAKRYILSDNVLYSILKKAAERYIGGENLHETLQKVRFKDAEGYKCSIEYMGENSLTVEEASQATNEFTKICTEIHTNSLKSTISLDLSHIGLGISRELTLQNLDLICSTANQSNIEVIISAESYNQTDHVIEVYKIAAKKWPNVSITLQAYLHRTKDDFQELTSLPGRIRIVKGAFETPEGTSIPRSSELNNTYLSYIDQLLSSNHKCSIATHDDIIQGEAKKLVKYYSPEWNNYEFESLYGIQSARLESLKREGFNTKLYFVYGKEWYLYLCNRIAEHPINLMQAIVDITN